MFAFVQHHADENAEINFQVASVPSETQASRVHVYASFRLDSH